jgi:glycerol-3-phosphate dehydrogenase
MLHFFTNLLDRITVPKTHTPPTNGLEFSPFHLIVIGGGISGAGIVRDATLRGLTVALFEQNDFASGTSSRTSKLIHGGIRYLEQGNLSLVFEASRERLLLQRLAPHLVRPLPFLFPIYKGGPLGRGMLKMGLLLYDLLAFFRNTSRHQMLNREETLQFIPKLQPKNLLGAGLYYDCLMNDARLCLENILEAKSLGAVTQNHTQVTAILKNEKGMIQGVKVRNRFTGEEGKVYGRVVVNSAGPWVDEICGLDSPNAPPKLRRTRGSHLLLPSLTQNGALVFRSKKDQRIFFIIPWEGMSLVGTTDIDFEGDPEKVQCPSEDIEYLLKETQRFFPKASIQTENIISTFSGVRPLVQSPNGSPSSVSREAQIFESPSGLISITGGKFTTYRNISEKVVNQVLKKLPDLQVKKCQTDSKPLWGGNIKNLEIFIGEKVKDPGRLPYLNDWQLTHLINTYGSRYTEIIELIAENKDLAKALHPSLPHIQAEILFSIRNEMAQTLSDVLRRRTTLALGPLRGEESLLETILKIMAQKKNWSPEEVKEQKKRYLEEIF